VSVWVLAELDGPAVAEVTLEALGEAAELARPNLPNVLAVAPADVEGALASLAAHGAGRIVLLERSEDGVASETDAATAAGWLACELAGGKAAATVLLGHTRYGRTAAPVLAARLDAALAPDAIAARRSSDGSLLVTRPTYGERLYASVRVQPGVPAVVTLRPRAIGVGPPEAGRAVPVERHAARVPPGVRAGHRRRLIPAEARSVDLREAERIVAGGRGVGSPDGFRLLQELADLLDAAVGGSRVAVDLGWLPWERQIGQSGRTVAPRLYIACGISGASQHLMGIQAAGTIVAINADRAAPILGVAHLGVVGDWRPIVTALAERLRARRSAAAGGLAPAPPGR